MAKVYEVVAQTVADEDVRHLFGVMGEGNMLFTHHLAEVLGVVYLASRREDGAISMADGYGRATGQVGVATVTHGPGLTNSVTPLVEAVRGRVPLVVLAGDTVTTDRSGRQDVDQARLVGATGAGFHAVRAPSTAHEDVRIAFGRARRERRPVVLNIPADLQEAEAEAAIPVPVDRPPTQRVRPSEASVEQAAELLSRAHRPVILAGRGAVTSGCRDELIQLAAEVSALLTTTLLAKGYFAGEPFDLGVCGGFGTRLSQQLVSEADCVVAVGCSLNQWTTRHGKLLAGGSVIQCDDDPRAIGNPAPDAVVIADAHEAVQALRTAVSAGSAGDYRTPDVADRLAAHQPGEEFEDESVPGGVDLRTLLIELNTVLPADRAVVVDGGHFTSAACTYLDVVEPSRFIFPLSFGSIGLALGNAIGASTAHPDRWTVCVAGDGSLMMSIAELETAVRLGSKVAVVVLDDGAYGAEIHHFRHRGMSPDLARFDGPDFHRVAQALDIPSLQVDDVSQVGAVPALLAEATGPVLVHARLNPDVLTTFAAEFFSHAVPRTEKSLDTVP